MRRTTRDGAQPGPPGAGPPAPSRQTPRRRGGGARVDRGPRAVRESLDDVVEGLAPRTAPMAPCKGGAQPGDTGNPSAATWGTVFGRWEETVGSSIARHARPLRLEGRVLVVAVDQPAWATQLRALAPGVLEGLRAATGEAIEHLDVVVRR